MPQTLDPGRVIVLDIFPGVIWPYIGGCRNPGFFLVEEELHQHRAFGIAVKYHLEIGCHGYHLVHSPFPFKLQESGQVEQVGFVAESQVGRGRPGCDGGISPGHDILPEGDAGRGRETAVAHDISVYRVLGQIVPLVDREHLLLCEDVV